MCDIPQTLCGKIALISGSSAGIGAAIAHELSARGASIVLNYPTSAEAAACQAVGATLVTPWTAVCADLSTLDGPAALVAAAVARFGHTIHILVNNAAVVPHASTWEASAAVWDRTFELNARGTFLLTQAVLPHLPSMPPSTGLDSIPLVDQAGIPGGGRIICIGSGSGRVPQLGLLTYAATKGALASMIKVMARELPPVYGCTVNGVAPGPVNTETFRRGAGDALTGELAGFEAATPCRGAVAQTEDIAWAVAWLAEERSKWVNGEYINVNGGLDMS